MIMILRWKAFITLNVMDHATIATMQAITMVVGVVAMDVVDGEATAVADRQVNVPAGTEDMVETSEMAILMVEMVRMQKVVVGVDAVDGEAMVVAES